MTYERWDVVAVPFPFIEGTESKRRPALVVSAAALHDRHRVYWTAMITTAKAGEMPDDIRISDHRKAGLPESCVIRPTRMMTLGPAQIDRRLGSIGSKERAAVLAAIKRFCPG